MDLVEALRTTGAVRAFTDEAVPDEVLRRILDTARFAPNGGNRQGWRVVVVQDPAIRAALRDHYVPGWYEYVAQRAAGLTPWSPVNDRAAEQAAIESMAQALRADAAGGGGGFAEHLDEVPALLVVLADLSVLATVDRDLDRYTLVGGASIYPFVWSVLLAARAEGLGGVITTMPIRDEPQLRALFGLPDEVVVAAVLALGHPVHQPTKLTRSAVDDFTWVDRYEGDPLGAS